jgi:hypothetical protein
MLSFEPSVSTSVAPEGKLFFLGALAAAARAGAARAGAGRVGARPGAVRPSARPGAARPGSTGPGKSLGGITISPSNEKSETNSTTINNDYSTVTYK